MKVLIISYYWPPAGGSGVQRWLKMSKYFPEYSVDTIVYTPENPSYPILDKSLESDIAPQIQVLKHKILEPQTFSKKTNKTQAGFIEPKGGIVASLIKFTRANLMFPDARFLWIRPSIKFLSKYLENNSVDWIISTGPPHSTHLIARALKRRFGIKWMADFRDPWTDIDYFHHLPFLKMVKNRHISAEQSVLKEADLVTVVSREMWRKYRDYNPNTHIIYNGYDGDLSQANTVSNKFSLVHVGSVNSDRNPSFFWQTLSSLGEEIDGFMEDLELFFVGEISQQVLDDVRAAGLEDQFSHKGYIPHNQISSIQSQAQVLVLLLNDVPASKGIVTGKVFEYFQAQRPILAIGPKGGDLDQLLEETQAGSLVDFDDSKALDKKIRELYLEFKANSVIASNSKNVAKFHRRNLAGEVVNLLKQRN